MMKQRCWMLVLSVLLVGQVSQARANPVPSIEFTGGALFDVCMPPFGPDIEPVVPLPIHVQSNGSAFGVRDQLEVSGVGVVYDSQYAFPGTVSGASVYGFMFMSYYAVPVGTPMTARIWTYSDTAYSQLLWYSEVTFECSTGSVMSLYSGLPTEGSTAVPNLGQVQISEAQPAYSLPDSGVARDSFGHEIWLPHDADGNGFDTYIVTTFEQVDERWWVALYLGGPSPVWVPLDQVSPMTDLDLEQ